MAKAMKMVVSSAPQNMTNWCITGHLLVLIPRPFLVNNDLCTAKYKFMVQPQSLVYIRELELAQLMTRKQYWGLLHLK